MTQRFRLLALVLAFTTTALLGTQASADVIKASTATFDVDLGGASAGSDFYGSGNDDGFEEYGLTTFTYTVADFGGPVTAINSVELTLTVNDRTFSDGDAVELFFTPDTGADLGGDFANLIYDGAFGPSGINPAQFVTAPVSLGVFTIPEMAGRAGGETDNFVLPFVGSAETALINAINTGTEFQILIAATVDTHDITYSGAGNTFDPGDPTLDISAVVIPEPSSAIVLLGMGSLLAVRRRR